MAVFESTDQLYECLGGLFEKLMKDESMTEKFANSGLVIKFAYTEPDAEIWLDASSKDPNNLEVVLGPAEGKTAIVEMSMKADIAHKFWLGNVNLMVALTRKQIIAKGPIPKIMKLLPVIKPAYPIYKSHLRELGREDMINVK